MNYPKLFPLLLMILLSACSPVNDQPDTKLRSLVENYIASYQDRKDWDAFLAFYSDSLYMEDVNLKVQCGNLVQFKAFYNWPDTSFQKLAPSQKSLEVASLVVEGREAVLRGHFNPFYWKGELQTWAGGFSIWLRFNEANKIVEQYDYIVYPARFLPTDD